MTFIEETDTAHVHPTETPKLVLRVCSKLYIYVIIFRRTTRNGTHLFNDENRGINLCFRRLAIWNYYFPTCQL